MSQALGGCRVNPVCLLPESPSPSPEVVCALYSWLHAVGGITFHPITVYPWGTTMSYQVADLHNFVTLHIITHSWSFTNLFHKNNIFKSKAPLMEISEICNTWGMMDQLTISSECCLCTLRFKILLIFHLNTFHYLFKWIIQFCTCKCQGAGVHLSAGVLTGDKHQLPWKWTYRWAWATHRDTKRGSSADQYALFRPSLDWLT